MNNTFNDQKFQAAIKPDLTKAADFAFGLPTAMVHLTAIDPLKKRPILGQSFTKSDSGKAAGLKWITKAHKGGYGIYFNGNDIWPPLGPEHVRANEREISTVHFLHVDVDPPEGTPADRLETVRAEMLAKIEAANPSIIVNSGNGYGVFFAIDPVPVTEENRQEIKDRNIALADRLGGDDCEDLCRVMRLPHTINLPNAKKVKAGRVPVLADIVTDERDVFSYSLGNFVLAAAANDDPRTSTSTSSTAYATIGEPDVPENVDLWKLEEVVRARIVDGAAAGEDRSAVVYGLACDLRRIGWSDGDILGVLTNPSNGIADHIFDQKQRAPLEQASRVIADMNRRGIVQVYGDAKEDFADLPDEVITPMGSWDNDKQVWVPDPERVEREKRDREAKAAARREAAAAAGPDDDDDGFKYGNRPGINVTKIGADLPKVARKVQKRFVKAVAKPDADAADQVFDMLGKLVHLSRNRLPPGNEGKFDKNFHVDNELLIKVAEPEWFADTLERSFTFFTRLVKKDGTEKDLPCGVPRALVKRMFAISQDWDYPKIKGTVETPTLRLDGTISDKPGYDKKGLLYFDPGAMKFPPIKDRPTKADALAALEVFSKPLVDFPFADEDGIKGLSKSVALAMMLTGICRRSLPTAPMFGIDAHEANTGKTQLAQVAAILMMGRETAARPGLPEDGYQLQNALAAAFEAGDAMILYDNIDGDTQAVEGDALCAALTSEMMQCRRLGGNSAADQIKARTNSLIVGTGNKLTFAGDMSKDRGLLCTLRTDKTLAERTFSYWPLDQYVIQQRAELVSAGLTILRAYQVAEEKTPGPNFRFPEWRAIVADALIWLGLPDPVQATERAKADDPKEEAQREVMRAWARVIGETTVSTSEAMGRREVLQAIAEARGVPEHKLSKKSAAEYIKGMLGIKLGGYRMMKGMDSKTNVVCWTATCLDKASLLPTEAPESFDTAEDLAQAEADFGVADGLEDLM